MNPSTDIPGYCNCPRTADLWRCPTGGTSICSPVARTTCALAATVRATGRQTWDATARATLAATPAPCQTEHDDRDEDTGPSLADLLRMVA